MGRYTGPACRLCRREGLKICDKNKCATVKRNFPPGVHGKSRGSKKSDYNKQLREKQKAKRIFGLSEKQMQKYYRKAVASTLESGLQLMRQLEHRFDNAVYRSGFATTRRQARQLVNHGIFLLNGRRATVPSQYVSEGDTFSVKERNKSMNTWQNNAAKKTVPPSWLKVDTAALSAQVISTATKEDVEQSVDTQMIIEFYSR